MPPESTLTEEAPAMAIDDLAVLGFGPDEDDRQAEEPSSGLREEEDPLADDEPVEASGVAIALFANQGKAAAYVNGRGEAGLGRQETDAMVGYETRVTVGEPIFTARGRGRIRMYLPLHLVTNRRDVSGADALRAVAYANISSELISPLSIRVEVSR